MAQAGDRPEVLLTAAEDEQTAPMPLQVKGVGATAQIETGQVTVTVGGADLLRVRSAAGAPAEVVMALEVEVEQDGRPVLLCPAMTSPVVVYAEGPVAAGSETSGLLRPPDGAAGPTFRYVLDTSLGAGSGPLRLLLTLTHDAERREPFSEPAPVSHVRSVALRFTVTPAPEQWTVGTDKGAITVPGGSSFELRQTDDLSYRITRPGQEQQSGTRAPGWATAMVGKGCCRVAVRHFWQNAPKGLDLTAAGLVLRLWAGAEPLAWEAGLAKTHEIVLELGAEGGSGPAHAEPLVACLPPAWACATDAAVELLPRDADMLRHLPYWDAWRAAGMAHWVNGMPYGFRDFGDGYMGGPYKGKNAYQNLEYDIPFNFLLRFLQTGDPAILRQAQPMLRHQADIDTENSTGRPWKHSPQHTTTEADLGHVFVRGLLLHHLLTGDRRSRAVALQICRYIAAKLDAGAGIGNERQIGWSLYALTGALDVLDEPRLRQTASATCERLLRGQAADGRFDIRWDNRIAFFNGIAGNGLLSVSEQTHDPALSAGLLRLARRTLGFYPEYACRTLNLFCWAARHSGDRRYLDALERTWESSLVFMMQRNVVAEETHAWRFPRFAVAHGLCALWDTPPRALPEVASWRSLRLRAGRAELVLTPRTVGSRRALVLLEGVATGCIELRDERGVLVRGETLAGAGRMLQAAVFELPAEAAWGRLLLDSRDGYAWQVHHDAGLAVTLHDPSGALLADGLPRAWCFVREGAQEIVIRAEALGEGFHSAVLYDQGGAPLAAARHFIDFQDAGRYEITLKAPPPVAGGVVSLELHELRILACEGLLPYWAPAPEDLINPERSGR
jgi:hypothetical protein